MNQLLQFIRLVSDYISVICASLLPSRFDCFTRLVWNAPAVHLYICRQGTVCIEPDLVIQVQGCRNGLGKDQATILITNERSIIVEEAANTKLGALDRRIQKSKPAHDIHQIGH